MLYMVWITATWGKLHSNELYWILNVELYFRDFFFCGWYCGNCYQIVNNITASLVIGCPWYITRVVGSAMTALPLYTNLSCSDKALLTGGPGFSSSLAVPGVPWGISSMPPIETPSVTQPILYSNDGAQALWLAPRGWGELAKVQDRVAWARYGV